MSNLVPLSYSRIDALETCPRKYYGTTIAKTLKDEPNENTNWGTDVHLAFAEYFKKGTPLPLHMTQYQLALTKIKANGGKPAEFVVEQKLAINSKYEPTGWFDKDVYIRIISDLTMLLDNRKAAIMWDWKTGKPKSDFTQLELAGAVMFLIVPTLQKITLAYYWLKTKEFAPKVFTRKDAGEFWLKFIPRIQRYQDAHATHDFPPRPNYLCERYCPDKACPFWGKR